MDYITSNWQIAVRKYQVVMPALKTGWRTMIHDICRSHEIVSIQLTSFNDLLEKARQLYTFRSKLFRIVLYLRTMFMYFAS